MLPGKKWILYCLVSIFTTILVLVSLDFSQPWYVATMIGIFGVVLTQWYLLVGLFYPRGEDKLSAINVFSKNVIIIAVSLLVGIYTCVLAVFVNSDFVLMDALILFLYVVGPTIILIAIKKYNLLLSAIWVWFPIEWNLISDHFSLRFFILPVDALLGLFALLWPAIMLEKHVPWYDWNVTKEDLKYTNQAVIGVTLAVVPAGLSIYFLKFNLQPLMDAGFPEAIGLVILVFLAIFIVQGLMEEILFRDLIFKHWFYKLDSLEDEQHKAGIASIVFAGLVVISIPFWGPILRFLASILPFLSDVANRVGNLERPLGDYEGAPIPYFEGWPLWPFYLGVGIVLIIAGLLIYKKHPEPMMAALIASSIIFGFAHFEDWRYVLFASFAGFGYGYAYYKTRNLVSSALVHMGVDAVWALVLQYP